MDLSPLNIVLLLALVAALAVFLRSLFKGSRLLGNFWDRERRRIDAIQRGEKP